MGMLIARRREKERNIDNFKNDKEVPKENLEKNDKEVPKENKGKKSK